LHIGDPKLRDLANLWSYKLTRQEYQLWRHFGDIIKLYHLKYVIKMTSQKVFIFNPPPPLAKSWLRPWLQVYLWFYSNLNWQN